ncbi:MAG: histidine kinase, partial [Verrucomicrobia bacterium]|nr:histidine kinase [Verrucomicrobiota bacterium]
SLTALIPPDGSSTAKERVFKRARAFFAEAIVPIEKTHQAARKTDAHLNQLDRTLRRRTLESSDSTQHLQRGIVQRRASEQALKKSGQQHAKLIEESRRLQKHLRHLTYEIVSAQEDDRRKLSHELHDEIAQILLGINIRLLALKKAAKAKSGSLNKEIASTQRLVTQSVKTINQFAREFGLHHEK